MEQIDILTTSPVDGSPRVSVRYNDHAGTAVVLDMKHGVSVWGSSPVSKDGSYPAENAEVEISCALADQLACIAGGGQGEASAVAFKQLLGIISQVNDIGYGTVERSSGVSIPARELTPNGVASAFKGWEPGDWRRA